MEVSIPLKELIALFGVPVVLLFFLVAFLVINWVHVEAFFARIIALFTLPAGAGRRTLRRLTVQNEINKTIVQLDSEVPNLFNEAARVNWINDGLGHANVKKGSIFIRVPDIRDDDRVFLDVVRYLLARGFLNDAQRYLHGHILRSARLVIAERFVQNSRFRSAQTLFREEVYNPAVEENDTRIVVNSMESLDHRGLFTRVFLRECTLLPSRLGSRHESSGPKWDVTSFLSYLEDLFSSIDDQEAIAEFTFPSKTINTAFAVLASAERYRTYGLGFYIMRTRRSIAQGANTVYIIAIGQRNTGIARQLAERLRVSGYISTYEGTPYSVHLWRKQIAAVCYYCHVAPERHDDSAQQDDAIGIDTDDEGIIRTLHAYIPEISNGDVQIVRSASIEGVQAVVVVHSRRSDINPVGACIGREAVRKKDLEQALNSRVRFVEWSADRRKLLVNCLEEITDGKILSVDIDPVLRTALIWLASHDAEQRVRQFGESLVRLTETITEMQIDFQVDRNAEIKSIIENTIPELNQGLIEIVRMSRVPEIILRIMVRSGKIENPAQYCGQFIADIKRADRRAIRSERIVFSEEVEDLEDTIRSALYPIDPHDIVRIITSDSASGCFADVYVKDDDTVGRAIGPEGAYVRTAGDIANCKIRIFPRSDLDDRHEL